VMHKEELWDCSKAGDSHVNTKLRHVWHKVLCCYEAKMHWTFVLPLAHRTKSPRLPLWQLFRVAEQKWRLFANDNNVKTEHSADSNSNRGHEPYELPLFYCAWSFSSNTFAFERKRLLD
jgi:hypothetical protein